MASSKPAASAAPSLDDPAYPGLPPAAPVVPPSTAASPFLSFHQQRQRLADFIHDELVPGVDYGAASNKRGAKPSLLKPGAEKIALWMGLRAAFRMDAETWAMAGSTPGLFCYVCRLLDGGKHVVGEGRGACAISERAGMTANNAIKIAAKRAFVDAVLRAAGASETFTQDLEDPSQRRAAEAEQGEPQPPPALSDRDRFAHTVQQWFGVSSAEDAGWERARAWALARVTRWRQQHPAAAGDGSAPPKVDYARLTAEVLDAMDAGVTAPQ